MSDYKIALLCNAYSTNSECFTLPMGVLVETIYGNTSVRTSLPGTNCTASGSVTPLPMNLLDSLTVHAKMRFAEADGEMWDEANVSLKLLFFCPV